MAKKRGKRVPENQLLNLALPTACALIGSVVFGIAGEHPEQYSSYLFLFGLGLMAFGFLGANTIGAVYVLECYPHLAGPALVNIASFRCILAFVLSFKVSEWVATLGYQSSMLMWENQRSWYVGSLLTCCADILGSSPALRCLRQWYGSMASHGGKGGRLRGLGTINGVLRVLMT